MGTWAEQVRCDSKDLSIVNIDTEVLTEILRGPMHQMINKEVNQCILSIKNGKAQDIDKNTIEHLIKWWTYCCKYSD